MKKAGGRKGAGAEGGGTPKIGQGGGRKSSRGRGERGRRETREQREAEEK